MRKNILIGASVLLFGCIVYFNRGDDAERDAAELLKKREASRTLTEESVADDDSLSETERNKPLPGDFITELQLHGYWRIGKRGAQQQLMLPYPPVQIPSPALDLDPVHENPGFVGADACKQCHEERHASFIHTAHHRTTALADQNSIAGSFRTGKNEMRTGVQSVSFKMIERDGRPFQRVSFYGWKCDVPFDIATGSSKLGQSYLFWHDDGLFQMQVSYVTSLDEWINSPGYSDGDAMYTRPVTNRCLECHTTWVDVRRGVNHYTPESLVLGISCERCHGPGRQHIDYHQQHPEQKQSQFITQPGTLPRERQLDICGQCHFGGTNLKGEPYQFRPGDRLLDHYHPPAKDMAGGVHSSNQLMRLQQSPCFNETQMTCTDCHNPHQSERGDRKLFSRRCLNCHETSQCGMESTLGDRLSDNCIDCHMRAGASENMSMETSKGDVFPSLRDHHIRVDRQLTADYLKSIL